MEGKALLYKYLGGVDGIAIMLDTKDPDKIIETVLLLQPGFGGVNLEDISNPKCFYILDTLREKAEIPVWHDDQQGTATVTLAGLINALKVVNKKMSEVKITFIGSGASNVACSRLIFGWGADPAKCLMVDSKGIMGLHRKDLEMRKAEYVDKWRLCNITNAEHREGDMTDAINGADVVIALSKSGPGTIPAAALSTMNKDAILFACANPVPEVWPWEAKEQGVRVVATGRSDFPNQVNNSLGFPGIFRGTLDVRAKTITDEMCFAAAQAMADQVADSLDEDHILPDMDDWTVFPREAAAVAMKAVEQGLALKPTTYEAEYNNAMKIIKRSRDLTNMMMEEGFIPEPPEDIQPAAEVEITLEDAG
jgi:malate dehydrogenase (oxaloacetate-decarboxylating)